jgi:hypothetical protein
MIPRDMIGTTTGYQNTEYIARGEAYYDHTYIVIKK